MDLIIGRGRKRCAIYPELIHFRQFQGNKAAPYHLITVDLVILVKGADYTASAIDPVAMDYFPDLSVDEIYFERIYTTLN